MKSLKRTLSLVLALVMVLGLFGGISMTAAASDFTDDENIQYKEAVDVLTGIGAIAGYPDGDEFSFQPEGLITRAEAAKIVAYTALGPDAPELLVNDVPTNFTDLGDYAWAIPSIEWLVKEGAIHGRSETIYDPASNVTGYEFLKMMLACLGYGANDEWTADKWMINALVLATKVGMTDGRISKEALSNPAHREEAALYCFNALGAELVTWSDLDNRYKNIGTESTYNPKAVGKTLGDEIYKLDTIDAVIFNNGSNDATCATKGVTSAYVYGKPNGLKASTDGLKYYDLETGLDLLGHHVTIYYKTENNTGDTPEKPYTAFAVIDESTVKTIDKAMPTSSADAANQAAIKSALGLTVNAADTLTTVSYGDCSFNYDSYVAEQNTLSSLVVNTGTSASNDTPICTATGYIQALPGQYIFSGSQLISYINVPTFDVSYVSAYTAPTDTQNGTITVKSSTILSGAASGSNGIISATSITIPKTSETNKDKLDSYAKLNIYDGIAKGDVILISETGEFITVAKAESVTGTVTDAEYDSTNDVYNVTVDGNTYDVNTSKYDASVGVKDGMAFGSTANAAAMVNQKMVLYFDANGQVVVAAKAEESADTNLVYVVKAYQEQTTVSNYGTKDVYQVKIQCVNTAGEEVNYTVGAWEDDTDTQQASPTAVAGTVVVEKKDASATTNTAGGMQLAVATATSDNVGARDLVGQIISVSTAMDSGIKADIATVTRATTLAAAQSTEISVGTATGPKAATAAYIAAKNYYTEDTQFIFVSQDGSDMKVTTATGAQAIRDQAAAAYYSTKSANAGNFDVKYVFVNNKPVEAQSDDLIYVPRTFNTERPTSYTDENNKPAVAYKNTVYINGELKDINIKNPASCAGIDLTSTGEEKFYTYTVDAQGLYTLTAADTSTWAVGSVRNVYGNKITINKSSNNGDVADVDTTGAFIVDPVYDDAIATDPKDTTTINHNSLASLLNDGTNAAKVAYSYTTAANGAKTITGLYYITTAEAKEATAKLSNIIVTFSKDGAADVVYDVVESTIKVSLDSDPSAPSTKGVASLVLSSKYNDLKGYTLSVKTVNDPTCKYGEVVSITDSTGEFKVPSTNSGTNTIDIVMKTEAGTSDDSTTYRLTITYV